MTEPTKRAPRKKTEEDTETPVEVAEEKVENSVSPKKQQPKSAHAVVGNGDKDPVVLSKIIPNNIRQKKSLSVFHLQRRLNELGYEEAWSNDLGGFYGAGTTEAVSAYQRDNELAVTGLVDWETLQAVFENDDNVDLHLS